MLKSQIVVGLILFFISAINALKLTHQITDQHLHERRLNVRNCLQELNKVIANHNGSFVSG